MPDGTTIKLFAARVHKRNAEHVKETAESELAYVTNKFIALCCSTPSPDMENLDERMREVLELVEAIEDASFRRICAQNIMDFPEDCEDDLED